MTVGTGFGEGVLLGVEADPDIGCVRFAFGIVPEVRAVGDDCEVLGLEEAADDDDDEGRAALAEVLALGA